MSENVLNNQINNNLENAQNVPTSSSKKEGKEKVLSVKDLTISFKTDRGIVHAVRGVSFDLYKGETLCIVGESGSGKSVTNKAIMGISAANAIIENGSIMYEGEDLVRVSEEEFHRIRGHKIGMIFQDPLSALNPVMKIGKQITEATLINKNILKRHYRDLISKELVKSRNSVTNYNYDVEKIKDELSSLKSLQKEYSKLVKKNKEEDLAKYKEKVEKHINDIKVIVSSEIERLNERVAHYVRKVNRSNENNESDLKKEIASNELANNKAILDLYHIFHKELEENQNNDDQVILSLRVTFLSNYLSLLKANFKVLNPLLKKDLSNRKKEAKIENKEYANKLKCEHESKMSELTKELEAADSDLKNYVSTLTEEELAKIDEVKKHNKNVEKIIKKRQKGNQDINISKTTKDDSIVMKETDDPKFNELEAKILEVKKRIQEEEEIYINKTKITKKEAKKMALEVMKEVGIPMAERRFKQYPFEFSGGMRQRIVIAIALTANPDILICDEPTTALDVTIQAQILELINRLKKERHLSCIFITHDLGVVANMADRVAVMYAGKIVEYGLANEVFFDPRHPYTWALLSSIPDIDSKEKLEAIPGTPPDMLTPPQGDAFALRSKYAMAIDFKYEPPFFKISDTHYAATWLLYPGAPKVEMPAIVKTRIENALKAQKEKEKNKEEEVNV